VSGGRIFKSLFSLLANDLWIKLRLTNLTPLEAE
jgi:hypothetical protein